MIRLFIALILSILTTNELYATQSIITESEGYACMGEDKSRKQTEQTALADAKRNAVENVTTYMKSETQVKDFELGKDLISAYTNAEVKIIQVLHKEWYKDASMGDCYKVRIKADVIPDEKAMESISRSKQITDIPSSPLNVQVWTDKKEYKEREKIKIYIRGNKPFYARIVYKDAGGNLLQLLPNPYRKNNYFNGGAVYELPSGDDRFEIEISPPFGSENITVYASTAKLGELDLEPVNTVYSIKTKASEIGIKTRGVILREKETDKAGKTHAEFSEASVVLKTSTQNR